MAEAQAEAARSGDAQGDAQAEERRKLRNLVRFVAVCVAVPSLTTGLAMAIWDPAVHAYHMVGFLVLGAAALALFAAAPALSRRWVPAAA